ncbi:MAG: hypothetical protein ACYDAO_00765 [Thermoplasmataceae archaeon]
MTSNIAETQSKDDISNLIDLCHGIDQMNGAFSTDEKRHYFMKCYTGNHERCAIKRVTTYKGKLETVYCECQCHAVSTRAT